MENFDILRELLAENRSTRIFDSSKKIDYHTLMSLIGLTRLCASGRNSQPLKYRIVNDTEELTNLFPALQWAGYYEDWDGPEEGKRPVAYLVQCLDTSIQPTCLCDDGIQLEAITLGARALGIASCIIKAFNISHVNKILDLPDHTTPRYILALGYPAEKIHIEEMDGTKTADYKYYRDSEGVHHVPKRPLRELIIY